MISELKEFLKELEKSKEFKDFKEKNRLAYNTSASLIDNNLQLDFYDPNKDKITSFTKIDNEIHKQTSEVFRKEKTEIKELKIDQIKIDLEDAEKTIAQKHPDKPTKKIIVLQQREFPIWNITYITTKLELLNIKINAITGKIVKETIEPIMKLQ